MVLEIGRISVNTLKQELQMVIGPIFHQARRRNVTQSSSGSQTSSDDINCMENTIVDNLHEQEVRSSVHKRDTGGPTEEEDQPFSTCAMRLSLTHTTHPAES